MLNAARAMRVFLCARSSATAATRGPSAGHVPRRQRTFHTTTPPVAPTALPVVDRNAGVTFQPLPPLAERPAGRELLHLLRADTDQCPVFAVAEQWRYVRTVRVVDGDTVEALLCAQLNPYDVRCASVYRVRLRLYGIDTPESRPPRSDPDRDEIKEAAQRARLGLEGVLFGGLTNRAPHLHAHAVQIAYFRGSDAFGRLLCDLHVLDDEGSLDTALCVNQHLIDNGLAVPYDPAARRSGASQKLSWPQMKAQLEQQREASGQRTAPSE